VKASSLAAFALCCALVLLSAACGGGGGSTAVNSTPSSNLHITAKGLKFDQKTLVAVALAPTTVTMDNKDGIAHNFALYTDKNASSLIFRGDVGSDRKAYTYTFTAPSAGSYYFRCDVHPDMNGTFVVQ
jgi:plastocyanin